MHKLLLALAWLSFSTSCSSQYKLLDSKEFSKYIASEKSIQLVDVRTPEEYNNGFIESAKNIDWNGSNFETELSKLDKTAPLALYCLSGGRSGNAMRKAQELGFTKIIGLDGGIMAWRSEKLPLVTAQSGKKQEMSLQEYENLYRGQTKKVLVDFYAEWCIPCQKMKPFLKKIETEYVHEVKVVRINADENPTLCQTLGVSGLPYVFIYKKDQIEWKKIGFTSEQELIKLIKN